MTRRILVVDDEPSLRKTLERALGGMGYEVMAVGDPRAAYELLEGGDFDLVLLDINLPEMSGDALFLALARRSPRIIGRVVLMSGDPYAVKAEWPEELARCQMLGKPFTLAALHGAIAAALEAADRAGSWQKRNSG